MSIKAKTFRFYGKKFGKYLAGACEVRTFASAFGQKTRRRHLKKRSLKGFHKDREVVQEAPALLDADAGGIRNEPSIDR